MCAEYREVVGVGFQAFRVLAAAHQIRFHSSKVSWRAQGHGEIVQSGPFCVPKTSQRSKPWAVEWQNTTLEHALSFTCK